MLHFFPLLLLRSFRLTRSISQQFDDSTRSVQVDADHSGASGLRRALRQSRESALQAARHFAFRHAVWPSLPVSEAISRTTGVLQELPESAILQELDPSTDSTGGKERERDLFMERVLNERMA